MAPDVRVTRTFSNVARNLKKLSWLPEDNPRKTQLSNFHFSIRDSAHIAHSCLLRSRVSVGNQRPRLVPVPTSGIIGACGSRDAYKMNKTMFLAGTLFLLAAPVGRPTEFVQTSVAAQPVQTFSASVDGFRSQFSSAIEG